MPRSYGALARTALSVGLGQGRATQLSFAAFLSAELGEKVTRDTVANWLSEREHVPGDVVVLMARHVPSAAQDIAQVLLDELGLVAVHGPVGLADGEAPLVIAGRHAGATGRLLEVIVREQAPDSPGGVERTPDELRARLALIGEAEAHLAQLRAETEAALAAAPRLRSATRAS